MSKRDINPRQAWTCFCVSGYSVEMHLRMRESTMRDATSRMEHGEHATLVPFRRIGLNGRDVLHRPARPWYPANLETRLETRLFRTVCRHHPRFVSSRDCSVKFSLWGVITPTFPSILYVPVPSPLLRHCFVLQDFFCFISFCSFTYFEYEQKSYREHRCRNFFHAVFVVPRL